MNKLLQFKKKKTKLKDSKINRQFSKNQEPRNDWNQLKWTVVD